MAWRKPATVLTPQPQVKRGASASLRCNRKGGNPRGGRNLVARIHHNHCAFVDSASHFRLHSVAPANRDRSQVCPAMLHGIGVPFATTLEQGPSRATQRIRLLPDYDPRFDPVVVAQRGPLSNWVCKVSDDVDALFFDAQRRDLGKCRRFNQAYPGGEWLLAAPLLQDD